MLENGVIMKKLLLFSLIFFMLFIEFSYGQSKPIPVNIGTGDKQGSLYPIGISIGKILNINSKLHKLNPNVLETPGDVYNIDKVVSGELMLAVVRSDAQFRAYKGLGEWEGMPQYDLRSIISIAPEYMQLIVSENSKIKTIIDTKGKNINLGFVGESTYLDSLKILSSHNLDNYTVNFDNTSETIQDIIVKMQDGRLDGFFITSIAPLNVIKLLSESTKIRLIDITGVNKLFMQYPQYKISTLDKQLYPKAANLNNIKTISVMSSLVTSSKTSNYAAYIMAKEIIENIEVLKSLHPAFKNINIKDMLQYNTAPIHPGAMRYYMDKGLLN